MTPLPPIPGIVKTQLQWSYGTDANVMSHLYWFGGDGAHGPNTADLQSLCNSVRSNYVSKLLQLSHSSVTLRTVTAVYLGDVTSAGVSATGSDAGTRTGSNLAASMAVLVNLKIARRYRGGRPRLYMPWGVQSDVLDPQHWASGFLNTANTQWAAFVAAIQALSLASFSAPTLANVSYYANKALRPTPIWDPVTSSAVNSIPGTQRRRLRP